MKIIFNISVRFGCIYYRCRSVSFSLCSTSTLLHGGRNRACWDCCETLQVHQLRRNDEEVLPRLPNDATEMLLVRKHCLDVVAQLGYVLVRHIWVPLADCPFKSQVMRKRENLGENSIEIHAVDGKWPFS